MKLRARGDTLRLRLTQSEVARFAETGLVEETITFGEDASDRLTYALAFGGAEVSAKLLLREGRMLVTVPSDLARSWAASNDVGIEAAQRIGGDRTLRITIEKDFACVKPRENEDDTDAYPHPNTSTTPGAPTEC